MKKEKGTIIDDGFNADLVQSAVFDGFLEIPVIHNNKEIIIPKGMVPFSERVKCRNFNNFVCFYEYDIKFRDILTATKEQLESLKKYPGIISPDCSLYRDMPLVLQMTNVYLSRQIGHYLQTNGIYVIPNIRWGDERTYKRIFSNELPFAFLGLEKGGVYSIGTYGGIRDTKNAFYFKEGLSSLIKELEPQILYVYGSMPKQIFDEFTSKVKFIRFDNWTKCIHGEK